MAVVDSRACPPVEAGGRTDARSLRSAASHAGGREPRFVVAGWRVRSAAPKAAAAPTDATLVSSNRRATGRGDLSWPAMTPCTISSVEHAARCSKPAARSVGEDAPRTHEQHLSSRPTPCAGCRRQSTSDPPSATLQRPDDGKMVQRDHYPRTGTRIRRQSRTRNRYRTAKGHCRRGHGDS